MDAEMSPEERSRAAVAYAAEDPAFVADKTRQEQASRVGMSKLPKFRRHLTDDDLAQLRKDLSETYTLPEHAKEVYMTRSGLHLFDDGSFLLTDGYGAGIRSEKGRLKVFGACGIEVCSAENLIFQSSGKLAVRCRQDIELTSTEGSLRSKVDGNMSCTILLDAGAGTLHAAGSSVSAEADKLQLQTSSPSDPSGLYLTEKSLLLVGAARCAVSAQDVTVVKGGGQSVDKVRLKDGRVGTSKTPLPRNIATRLQGDLYAKGNLLIEGSMWSNGQGTFEKGANSSPVRLNPRVDIGPDSSADLPALFSAFAVARTLELPLALQESGFSEEQQRRRTVHFPQSRSTQHVSELGNIGDLFEVSQKWVEKPIPGPLYESAPYPGLESIFAEGNLRSSADGQTVLGSLGRDFPYIPEN
jgi:hypothetical protein